MHSPGRQVLICRALPAIVISAALFLAPRCKEASQETASEVDLTAFKEMARAANCAETRNRLFLVDGTLVFWDRGGNCPDAAYSQILFERAVDRVLCDLHDSIAGPVGRCHDDRYRGMFETMVANLEASDLGLGPGHTVQPIPF